MKKRKPERRPPVEENLLKEAVKLEWWFSRKSVWEEQERVKHLTLFGRAKK